MKKLWMIFAIAAVSFSLGAIQVRAQGPQGAGSGASGSSGTKTKEAGTRPGHSLNPIKWVKKDSNKGSDQRNANSDRDKELTSKLQAQGLIPSNADLADVCSGFKGLSECLAAIHASHNLGLNFNCLKWDMTGAQPKGDVSPCGTPGGGGMSLREGIHFLNPDANAKGEAKTAEKQAHEDLK